MCCVAICLTLLASLFLPSHLSLKHDTSITCKSLPSLFSQCITDTLIVPFNISMCSERASCKPSIVTHMCPTHICPTAPYQPTEGTVSSASPTVNLTVSVSPTSSLLPTDTFNPKTHQDLQLMHTAIVASTCGFLVLVVVVVVAVALLLCLRARKRKSISKTSNNHSSPVPGISNPNYTGG